MKINASIKACKEYIQKVSSQNEEISQNLSFYVPCYYVPLYTKKSGMFNNEIKDLNLYYSNIYNPFYANSCGGLDIGIENFLVDFVNHTKPNVIISGNSIYNIIGNDLEGTIQEKSSNWLKQKKGIFSADILFDNIKSNSFDLIETFAYEILNSLRKYNNISKATVTIHKPNSPLKELVEDISVTASEEF